MVMGCYGLGIGRTVAAAIEQNHDQDGIVWPLPLAPFEVLLLALNPEAAPVMEVAERTYAELRQRGVDVLFDDRDERPGVKFKDADLIGVPLRIVVGAKSLAKGEVELSLRRDRQKLAVPAAEAVARRSRPRPARRALANVGAAVPGRPVNPRGPHAGTHLPGRRLHRSAVRRQPGGGVPARAGRRSALDAAGGARDERRRDRLPRAALGRRVEPALVLSRSRSAGTPRWRARTCCSSSGSPRESCCASTP
jgi:hypothetical protein